MNSQCDYFNIAPPSKKKSPLYYAALTAGCKKLFPPSELMLKLRLSLHNLCYSC